MTQMIDPTGLPKGVWGIILDYAAPSKQDMISCTVTHESETRRKYSMYFAGYRLVDAIDKYYKLGNAFGFSDTRLDKPIRIFAMQTFVLEVPRSIGQEDVVEQWELNLREAILFDMTIGDKGPMAEIYPILQRAGLISETAGENGKKLYSIVTQADEPTEKVKLTKSDVNLEHRERPRKRLLGPDGLPLRGPDGRVVYEKSLIPKPEVRPGS